MANFVRIAAFKKVSGPEVHEMDRTIFKDTKDSKIFRKKKYHFNKAKFAPKQATSTKNYLSKFQ